MNIKPWKLSLIAAFSLAGSAAFAQNVQTARKAIDFERYSEAKRTLLPLSQTNYEAAYQLGRLYEIQDRPDSAAYFFDMAAREPKSPMASVAAGRAMLAQGKRAEAEIQFEKAVKDTKGKKPEILAAIGQAYAESDVKDNQKGIDYLNQALKVNKKDDPAMLVSLGDIHQKRENGGGEAMTAYDRATLADPNYLLAFYRKGQLNVRARNGNEALTNFQKVASLDPNFAPVYRDMAEMYYYGNQYDQAAQTMQKYTDMSEKSPNTQATYAAFLYLNKKYPEALTQIQEVLAKEPNNLTMNRLQAYTLFETGQNDKAMAAMEKYMAMAPKDKIISEDYVYQGKILTKGGRSKEGIAIIERAIAADPKKAPELLNDLAAAYLLNKDYANAARIYTRKMAEGTPQLTDQVRLANIYGLNKQYQKADSLMTVVVTARPTYAAGHLMRAQFNANLDPDTKEGLAKPHYEKFIELTKEETDKYKDQLAEANRYLGYYYYQKGEKQASLPYWQQALVFNPGDQQASAAIKDITAKGKTAPKTTSKAPVRKK